MRRTVQPPSTAPGVARAAALLLVLVPSTAASEDPETEDPPPAEVAPPVAEAPAAQELAEPAGPAPEERDEGVAIHGYLRTRYLWRGTSGEYDHDLYNALILDVGTVGRDPFTAHLHAYLGLDLDGDTDPSFTSISDSYDDSVDMRLYLAYVDVHDVEGLERARVGRQQNNATPVLVWFDGVGVETEAFTDLELSAGAYGGQPVHIFESSPDGDALLGAYVESRPWDKGRWRLDYVRFSDQSELGDEDNDLWYVDARQGVADGVDLGASYSYLDDESRDYRLRGTAYHAELDATLRVSYYELLETQGLLALELDPLFSSLLELFPYTHTSVLASKGYEDWLLVEGGVDFRDVSDADDEGEFNRDFNRYYLNTILIDVVGEGLDLTLTADAYESDRTDIRTWGADLTKEMNERLDASLGSYYSLYKYDLFLDEERDDVRTYYVRLDYDRTEHLSFDLDYEYEDSDLDNYQTLKVGLSWRF